MHPTANIIIDESQLPQVQEDKKAQNRNKDEDQLPVRPRDYSVLQWQPHGLESATWKFAHAMVQASTIFKVYRTSALKILKGTANLHYLLKYNISRVANACFGGKSRGRRRTFHIMHCLSINYQRC